MIPLLLELENFLSYRQPAVLDFTGIRLACIAGENGAGKSSLLDAITWVLFGRCRAPGRDDVVNRQAIPLGQAARVQLDFELEGERYRVLRLQTPGRTGVLELQLATGPDQWKSLTESTQSRTQEQLEALLRMNYESFTNASFLLQGRADEFTVKRPGERKRILGELLGVSHWEHYKEESARRRRELEREQAGVQARLGEIQAELAQEPARQQRLKDARSEYAAAQGQRQTQEQLFNAIQAYEAAVKGQQTLLQNLADNLRLARAQLQSLELERAERQVERDGLQEILDQAEAIEAEHARWRQADSRLRDWEAKAVQWSQLNQELQRATLVVERERSRLEAEKKDLARRQEEAAARQAQQAQLQQTLDQTTARVAALRESAAVRPALQAQLGDRQGRMGALKNEQPRLKKEMQTIKARQVQLQSEESGRCPFCDQELTLEHRASVVARLEQEGIELGDRYRQNEAEAQRLQEELAGLRAELERVDQVDRELRTAERSETATRTQLDELDRFLDQWQAEGAPRLQQVEAQLSQDQVAPEAAAQVARWQAALDALGYDAELHAAARQEAETLSAAQDRFRDLGEARAALQPLQQNLKSLAGQIAQGETQLEALSQQHQAAQAALAELGPPPEVDLVTAGRELSRLREQEAVASRAIGAAEQSLQALEQLRELQVGLTASRREMAQLIGRHKVLERAFGRDGVQALLIEQALPAIQDSANQLLDRLTGGEMRITFSTQRQLKSRDALAETLDIHIADGVGERPYEMYSGGEAFRVNFAIRIALSRLLAQRAGARLQTLVIDEGFGSQDPEGRQRLIEAINIIQPDFARVLVITHIEELKDAFPVRVEVTKGVGGSQLAVV